MVAVVLEFAGAAAGSDQHVVALVDAVQYVGDALADALGRDAVLGIVGFLFLAPAIGLRDGALHGACEAIRIENDAAVDVAGGAPDGLDQRGLAAQETFLVGVQDGDQGAFRNVEALAQQVDPHQRIEGAEPQVADDLDALDRVDVGMHVAHPDALLMQVFGQILRHALGQHRDQRPIAFGRHLPHLAHQVVHLGAGGADIDRRIDEPGRADHLLHEHAA